MKKIKILLLALVAVGFMTSCNDDSGDYVRYMFTNGQKNAAVTKCLNVSLDSALNRLCTYNGFYTYDDNLYRIDFEGLCPTVLATLRENGHSALTDSLVLFTNRMAENCKLQLDSAFTRAIKSLEITDYDALIYGDKTAITDYLEFSKYREIKSYMQTPVSIRMSVLGINSAWNEMMNQYRQYSNQPVNVDLQSYIIDEMVDGVFNEMRVQERLIRRDSVYRAKIDSVMNAIFMNVN